MVTDGGEVAFVGRMVEESLTCVERIRLGLGEPLSLSEPLGADLFFSPNPQMVLQSFGQVFEYSAISSSAAEELGAPVGLVFRRRQS